MLLELLIWLLKMDANNNNILFFIKIKIFDCPEGINLDSDRIYQRPRLFPNDITISNINTKRNILLDVYLTISKETAAVKCCHGWICFSGSDKNIIWKEEILYEPLFPIKQYNTCINITPSKTKETPSVGQCEFTLLVESYSDNIGNHGGYNMADPAYPETYLGFGTILFAIFFFFLM